VRRSPDIWGRGPADAVDEVVDLVVRLEAPDALNVYDEAACTAAGERSGAAAVRIGALRSYLMAHWSAPTVLVGEAPGQHGARWTGVPFTSLRQLTGSGPDEATARIVQRVLTESGWSHRVLLWNASVLLPPGKRAPLRAELDACAPVLDLICRGRTVLAVGRHAQRVTGAPYIRHPSHGGASLFAAGLRAALGPQVETGAVPVAHTA
jgi:hypothetical protein